MNDPCTRCRRAEIAKCYECLPCHSVTLCMIIVHRHWRMEELEGLEKRLHEKTIAEFIAESRNRNAFIAEKLGKTILALSYPAKVSPDSLRLRVCGAIAGYLAEMTEIAEWEKKQNNPGAYMQHWIATVTSWIKKAKGALV